MSKRKIFDDRGLLLPEDYNLYFNRPPAKRQQTMPVIYVKPASSRKRRRPVQRSVRSAPARRYRSRFSYADKDAIRQSRYDQWNAMRMRGSQYSRDTYGANKYVADPQQRLNRLTANFKGQGDFFEDMADIARRPMEHLKGLVTDPLSAAKRVGWRLLGAGYGPDPLTGYNMGKQMSQFAGSGDYAPVTSNALIRGDVGDLNSQSRVTVNASSDGGLEFSYREYLGNVTVTAPSSGTSTFNLVPYAINPGLPQSFPFLSQIAQNFTLYELHGLMYQYVPTSGEYGSTNSNSLGKVVMATNYDPDAANFYTSQQMENYEGAASCKPSCGQIHGVETDPSQRATSQMYVRSGAVSKDKVFTDIGTFQIATEGIYVGAAGTFVIGELWVSYKIKLLRPSLTATLGLGLQADQAIATASAGSLANAIVYKGTNTLGSTLISATGGSGALSAMYSLVLSSPYYYAAGTPFNAPAATSCAYLVIPTGNLASGACLRVDIQVNAAATYTQYISQVALVQGTLTNPSQCTSASLCFPMLTTAPATSINSYSPWIGASVGSATYGNCNPNVVQMSAGGGGDGGVKDAVGILSTYIQLNNISGTQNLILMLGLSAALGSGGTLAYQLSQVDAGDCFSLT